MITNKIPLSFNFEFIYKRQHDDIKVEPLKGVIPGKSSVEISITFTASI